MNKKHFSNLKEWSSEFSKGEWIFFVLLIMLTIVAIIFINFSPTIIDESGIVRKNSYGFLVIKEYPSHGGSGAHYIAYDPGTKICYLIVEGYRKYGIAPYYIVNEKGEPEIAIYGKNYNP